MCNLSYCTLFFERPRSPARGNTNLLGVHNTRAFPGKNNGTDRILCLMRIRGWVNHIATAFTLFRSWYTRYTPLRNILWPNFFHLATGRIRPGVGSIATLFPAQISVLKQLLQHANKGAMNQTSTGNILWPIKTVSMPTSRSSIFS